MKEKKALLAWAGIWLAILAAVLYAVFYGKPNGSMNSMSWLSFWLLLGAGAFAAAATLLKKAQIGSYLLALCSLIAFVLSIYAFYPYISAAFVGIDSTWETSFFVVIGLMLACVIVNIVAAMQALPFRGKAPKIALPVCASLLSVLLIGGVIANENAPQISGFLKTPTSVEVHTGDPNEDTQYYKSNYASLSELMAAGRNKAEEAMSEGIVLLRNENDALPLRENERKVGFFGISAIDPVYGGTGSGNVDTSSAPSWKTAFERGGLFTVNEDLWNWYSAPEQETYKRTTGQTGPGVTGAKSIGEAPWDVVRSANGESFSKFGDVAIVIISRLGGEGSDMPRGTLALSKLDDIDGSLGDTVNGDYLKLSPKEQALLAGLKAEKEAGTIKKIVVLLNFANQVEADFIDDEAYGIDAALWIGTPGQVGMYAVADVLAGNVNPSGRLSATFWRSHEQNPALANFGVTAYAGADNIINADGSPQQDRYYVVYQEGIYVGYRYTESRYEDYVMQAPNVGTFEYAKAVSFPFGFGKSYSTFNYSDYKVEKNGAGEGAVYTVSVTVTNSGAAAGKETVQIYLQKPYGEYNKANGVEASSCELVGFSKTKLLNPGESETLIIPVSERQFAAYDANTANTYVIVDGDYYLTAARNAHDAVNNFLAKKGFTPENTEGRMDAVGSSELVSDAISLAFDKDTYSTSEATGYPITNRFEYADWNKYEHRGEDAVTYISRSDWEGTTPKSWADTTVLHWNEYITADQDKYGRQSETKLETVDLEYPKYNTIVDGEILSLIDLRVDENGNEIPYEDAKWDRLLDQLSWEDYTSVIPSGMRRNGGIEKINKMECLDHNGPSGLTQPYSTSARGLASQTGDPDKNAKAMCYPAGGILAASFNTDLMYDVGDLIGEDALWAGYNGLYGPGSNIQRTPYSGRNFEYYSEDGYLSGMICAYECAAIESHGMYVYNKHIGLNDQEDLRRGICTWANEQAIREIYMRAFELPITIAGKTYDRDGEALTLKGASGVMLAFNRMGLHWSGMQRDMVTEFLRNECGMTGIVVTDMWYGTASPYMNLPKLLTSGGNLVDGMMKAEDLDASRPGSGHADVAWGMREAMHRILYTVVHSNAMNGISAGTKIVQVTPWWQTLVIALQIGFGVLTAAAFVWVLIKAHKKEKAA